MLDGTIKKPQSRFVRRTDYDAATRGTQRALDTLELFNDHRVLPFNAIHELVPVGSYRGHANQCTRLFHGLLLDRRTFDGSRNTMETLTYSRTDAGERFLRKYSRPVYSDYGTAQDDEQLLIDLADAGLKIAMRGSDVTFHPWHEIKDHEETPLLPKYPLRFEIDSKSYLVPDGLPFYLKRPGGSLLVVKEVIRTNRSDKALREKVRHYRIVERLIKKRFNFDRFVVAWIATDAATEHKLLRIIAEEMGKCQWMLTQLMRDPIAEHLTTAPIPLHLFHEPWRRAGYPPFSLKTLSPEA